MDFAPSLIPSFSTRKSPLVAEYGDDTELSGRPSTQETPVVGNIETVIRKAAEVVCEIEPELTKLDTDSGVSLSYNVNMHLLLYITWHSCNSTESIVIRNFPCCLSGYYCKIGFSYTNRGVMLLPCYF